MHNSNRLIISFRLNYYLFRSLKYIPYNYKMTDIALIIISYQSFTKIYEILKYKDKTNQYKAKLINIPFILTIYIYYNNVHTYQLFPSMLLTLCTVKFARPSKYAFDFNGPAESRIYMDSITTF